MTPDLVATPALGRSLLYWADGWSGAFAGLLFYGSWAVWANWEAGTEMALRAGGLHGATSFVVTLSGTTCMKRLFRGHAPAWWRATRAGLGTLLLIYGLILGVHLLNGTPEILLTLAPGLPITIAFCLSYCLGLARYGDPTLSPSANGRPA